MTRVNKQWIETFWKAIQAGHANIVQEALERGVDINTKDSYDNTALFLAVCHNQPKVIEVLIENGADVNVKESSGDVPLITAIDFGHLESVEALLKGKPDINMKDSSGYTALDVLDAEKYPETAALLKEAMAQSKEGKTTSNESISFITAAKKDHVNTIRELIKDGVYVNDQDNEGITALMFNSFLGYNEIVQMLIKAGADMNRANSRGTTALMFASQQGHSAIAQMLIKAGADVDRANIRGATALMFASHGHVKIAQMLIKAGVDLNGTDKSGSTALMYAAVHGNTQIVQALTNAGADVSSIDNEGNTAFDLATSQGYTQTAQYIANVDKAKNIVNQLSHESDENISMLSKSDLKLFQQLMITGGLLEVVFRGLSEDKQNSILRGTYKEASFAVKRSIDKIVSMRHSSEGK